jgi:hypothetical protein
MPCGSAPSPGNSISLPRSAGCKRDRLRGVGPPVYNQGVRDAARYLEDKLSDIDGELYEREPPT